MKSFSLSAVLLALIGFAAAPATAFAADAGTPHGGHHARHHHPAVHHAAAHRHHAASHHHRAPKA